jgi:hypothetical protein
MDTFSYISVLFSVVLGLALTQVLLGLRALMLARSRVVPYWPALIWAVLMVIIVVQVWWSMFGMQTIKTWNFVMYGAVMLQITVIYLAAGLAVPDIPADGPVKMREDYVSHAPWFFALLAVTILATFLKDIATIGHVITGWNAWYLGSSFVLFTTAALLRWRSYHAFLAPFSLVGIVCNIALLSLSP